MKSALGAAEAEGGMMRKLLVGVLVVLLGVAMLALVGCSSGDTATAKSDMKAADAAFAPLDAQLTQLATQSTTLVTAALSGNAPTINPADLQKVASATSTLLPEIASVKADYQKILTLSDVADYKAYATAMVKNLDADAAVVTAGQSLLAKLAPVIQSGDTAALNAAISQSMSEIQQIQTMQKQADDAKAAAEKIKADKGL
jgi:ABC-type oligopeptide transport system substrate-binding subunit